MSAQGDATTNTESPAEAETPAKSDSPAQTDALTSNGVQSTHQETSKIGCFFCASAHYVLGSLLFAGITYSLGNDFGCNIQVFKPIESSSHDSRLVYTLQWSLLLLIPLCFATLARNWHKCNTLDTWLQSSMDVSLQYFVNLMVLSTHINTDDMRYIPAIVVTAVSFRFLHLVALGRKFELIQTASVIAGFLCNILLFSFNFYMLYGHLCCHWLMTAAGLTSAEEVTQKDESSGSWF